MRTSVVIPAFTASNKHFSCIANAVDSYMNQCDELIVVEDGGWVHTNLVDAVDIYIRHKENQGFTKAVNTGWKVASGDYVAIVNSDTFMEDGQRLDSLCKPGKITYPKPAKGARQFGAFFVVPRGMEDGYLDEQFKMYYSDDDFYRRMEKYIEEVPSVTFHHAYGFTTNVNPYHYRKISREDKFKFERKWGRPDDSIQLASATQG